MALIDEIKKGLTGQWSEKNGILEYQVVVAERKAFLSTKKLTYIAKMRIDDAGKTVKFTEMLKEAGAGLDASIGFKTETYSTGFGKPREGSIQEQSDQFGKQYQYSFDWSTVRTIVEKLSIDSGYQFLYQITSIGL